MTLLTRIVRLFKADLHGLLDSLEEPDMVLKQAIREMEEDIARDEARLDALERSAGRLAARAAESAERLRELDRHIDLCFDQANEALARSLIRRKLEQSARGKILASRADALEAERAGLRALLAERREKLGAVLQKQELFADTKGEACEVEPEEGWGAGAGVRVSEEELEVAFMEEKQRRCRAAGAHPRPEA